MRYMIEIAVLTWHGTIATPASLISITSGLPEHFNFLVLHASHAREVIARFPPFPACSAAIGAGNEVEGPALAFVLVLVFVSVLGPGKFILLTNLV